MVVFNCVDDEDYLSKSEFGLGKRVILFFYWDLCEVSLKIKPKFDELCRKYEKTAIIYTFQHYGDDLLTSEAFEITKTPTILVMDDGCEIQRIVGEELENQAVIEGFFEKYAI
ncbi:unnamed protein product [Caenorhabditis angaria]|uniref:Thioredoxin domain-containing protein n=1 Tax=Caenorhabditis angaria TaxID=860376 RepID=A0A9P1MTX0_9PELO|nr:unnamed protein product [Caenorhabditis angaria]